MNYLYACVLFVVLVVCNCRSIKENPFQLTVIHINDFHARFEETSWQAGPCKNPAECIGGFSRLYRELWSHQDRPNVVYLNAGDNFQGSLWYTLFTWNVTQHFLNMLPADAYTLGNHEFDHKIAGVVPFIKALKVPTVVANIDDSEEPSIQGTYSSSIIIERGGKKIGIIGAIASNTNTLAQTEKLHFLDEIEEINKEAEYLTSEHNCDILIALTHCGLDVDKEIAAKAAPRLNLIVGGHSHSLLYNGKPPGPGQVEGPYPVVVEREGGRKVIVVQASAYTSYVGNLTVFYDDNGEIVDFHGLPIFLSHDKPQDESINEELTLWKKEVDIYGKRVIGKIGNDLLIDDCHLRECNIGNFFSDAMIDYYKQFAEPGSWTYVAIGIINSGGMRTSLNKGNLTLNDLLTCIPFQGTIDTGELKGSIIKDALEFSVTEKIARKDHIFWQFLQVSGLHFTVDLSKPEGNRITDLQIRCQECREPEYEPYDPEALYRVAMPSFVASGGDGYEIIKNNIQNYKQGPLDVSIFEDYAKRRSPIYQDVNGRITIINADLSKSTS